MTASLLLGVCAAALLLVNGAHARQTNEYANLNTVGLLPVTGGAGGVASAGISADGDVIAFHSNATDLVPGIVSNDLQVYVRDRRCSTTVLVSTSTAGAIGNGDSHALDVSWQGRWVLFRSLASNLDSADVNTFSDVFVHDLETSTTSIASLGNGSVGGNALVGSSAAISADGRLVVFDTFANNWVAGDTNNGQDVYVRDRVTATTELVSVGLGGGPGNGTSFGCDISNDGRYVVFSSSSSDLVAGDTNSKRDVFLRDMVLGTTTLVSVATNGVIANQDSLNAKISLGGRFVVFQTTASNLDPADTNGFADVYVRDVTLGTTTRVSVGLSGNQFNHNATLPSISADGSFVGFSSQATNHGFVDPNGFNSDVFVMHVPTLTLRRVSEDSLGVGSSHECTGARICDDGRSVVFVTSSPDLVRSIPHNNFVNLLVNDAMASSIQTYCFGDGSGATCPCGQGQSGATASGCANSAGTSGRLSASGNAQVTLDTVTITASGMSTGTFALLLQGTASTASGLGTSFGDGLLCVSGTLARLSVHSAPSGSASFGLAASEPSLAALGAVPVTGGMRFYQGWYRDAHAFCTPSTFNLTNGVEIDWAP